MLFVAAQKRYASLVYTRSNVFGILIIMYMSSVVVAYEYMLHTEEALVCAHRQNCGVRMYV